MNDNNFKYITIISGIIITFNLCSGMLGPKIIDINIFNFHTSVTCGVIPFCIAFFFMDLFTNQYGVKYANQLSTSVAACNLILGILLYLLVKIPTSHLQNDTMFQNEFAPMIKAFFIGTIATIISFYTNTKIFSKIFIFFKGKHLWLRCIGATSLGELIYSFIFDVMYFAHHLSLLKITEIVFSNYGFKVIFEVISLPLTYIAVNLLTQYEAKIEIEHSNFKLKKI